jgi:asparagine synthase (glutamine-hydrolysing)
LSGDGGDELFAGHTRYHYFQLLNRLRSSPDWLTRAGKLAAGRLRNLVMPLSTKLAERLRQTQKALELSALSNDEQIFKLASYFDEGSKRRLYDIEWSAGIDSYVSYERWSPEMQAVNDTPLASMLAWDFETNLVDDCLVKVDRASMACSLEVRSPFLDHRVVEFAMKIPPEYKLRKGVHKFVLKRAFADLLPETIVHRRKHGFEVPFAQWFQREPWRSFLLDMLAEDRLRSQGIFNAQEVIHLRDQFLRDPKAPNLGLSAYQLRHRVWMLFVLQVWYDQFMKVSSFEDASSSFNPARDGITRSTMSRLAVF